MKIFIIILLLSIVSAEYIPDTYKSVGQIQDIIDIEISATAAKSYGGYTYRDYYFVATVIVSNSADKILIIGEHAENLKLIRIGQEVFLDIETERYITKEYNWRVREKLL